MAGYGGRSNILGKEEDAGKLHEVRRDSGIIVSQTAYGKFTWNLRPPDEGG